MKKQLLFILISTMWSISMFSQTVGGVPKAERDALLALYNATDGSNWNQNTNWNTENDVAQWYGVTVESGYVTALNLDWNQLSGTIPAEIGGLTNLRVLSLYGNQLTGSIPTEMGQMINLTGISLRNNQLTGAIPSELSNLINLESLNLDNNQLSENIPSELGEMVNLNYLYLSGNQLSGTIPPELSSLDNLECLDLSNNQLEGAIPSELSELINIWWIDLTNNQLTKIEGDLSNSTNSYYIQLARNKLTFADLETANINISSYSPQGFIYNNQVEDGDNITLSVLESAGGENFQWYKNNVKVDEETKQQITVVKTEADTYFCKVTHSKFPDLTLHSINSNQIIGGVFKFDRDALLALYNATDGPNWNQNRNWNTESDVAQWYGVTVESGYVTALNLNWNQLTGTIPAEIGGLTNLRVLSLYGNQLTGSIPTEIGQMINLTGISLRNNQLTGAIPSELSNLINLESLNLDNNQLSGSIPSELGNLTKLYSLDLRNNQLTGSIPSQLNELTHLQYINLSNNQLSSIEGELSNLTNVYSLNLEGNKLTFADLETASINISSYSPQNFIYNNQVEDGDNIILTAPESAGGESFQWYKNNVKVDEETNQQITVAKTEADAYFCKVTHSKFPDLTLHSINANQIIGGVFKFDRDALLALYNATDGPNWNQNRNWNTENDVAQWYGVTVESGYVTALNLDWNQLTGTIPAEIGGLTNLRVLSLYDNQLSGSIPIELGKLTNLNDVNFGNNQLTGSIPLQLNELSHLRYLYLSNNQLSSIEGELSNLTNVYSLNLEGNKLTFADLEKANVNISSYSPQNFIYNNQVEDGDNIILTAPESAGGESFQWYKNNVKVDEETNQQITVAKTEADAYFCKVTHSKFPDLTLHSINANQIIGGVFKFDRDALLALYNATDGPNWNQNTNWNTESDVAQWYGVTVESGYVTELYLDWNQLSGTIPAEIGGLTNLREISLYNNQLSGNIPSELGNLTNLYRLDLRNNQLTGSIPLQLNELSHLRYLYLSNNQLSSIEGELSNLTNVYSLNLAGNKLTFADLETANINISSYSPQNFIYNNLVEDGDNIILTVPESAGGENFQWYKNNVKVDEETNQQITVAKTEADAYFCKVTHSRFPDLTLKSINSSQIVGGVLKSNREALIALYNATDGPNWNQNTNWNTESDVAQWYGVTVEGGYVTALNLDWNQLTGTIPAEIGGLTNLRVLSLYGNQLTDIIPNEVGELINLNYLVLNDNQLSGTIPAEIGRLKNLRELYLNRNQLTGIIPNEVGELINLNYLDLSNNQLEGAIPSELSELINIWWINLTNNQFSKIEGDLSSLTNIYSFNLAENRLTFTDLEKANIKINSYSPQAMLGITQTEDVNNITLFTSESDGGESYQWYKDEVILDGSTSKELTVAKRNLGIYHCKITHSKFPSLTLRTEDAEVHTYMLAYIAGANGTISGNAIQVVNKGNNATAVEAVPNQNYHFVEWSDGIKTAKRTDSYITQNLLVEATFSINPYLVTFFVKKSNGSAIFNATITIDGEEITTDEEGKVSIKLLGGNYTYVASLDGRQIASEEINIIEGNSVVNIIDLFTEVKADYIFNLEISPNPFTDQLTIRKTTNVVRVEITDLTGKRLFSQNYSGETDILINSSAFDTGFYLVSIYTSYGIKTVEKVMKK